MTADAMLEIIGLSVDIVDNGVTRRVLTDINLRVEAGQAYGLVGESGSGKSMLLRTILGILPPAARVASGEVLFHGQDILRSGTRSGYRTDVRGSAISMIFQEPSVALNPIMRVGQQISDSLRRAGGMSKNEAREAAISLMEKVGIRDSETRVDAYPFQLSGGMRQRVMIAAAMAMNPQLLLCDEPTTALDITIQAQVIDLFRSLQSELGVGLLYVTHDVAVVANLCTEIAVMKDGSIVERGSLQDVFDKPQNEYTKRLLQATPRIGLESPSLIGDANE